MSYKDFDENPQGVKYKANITRWRLEPKDEDREKYLRGELVEPKKPIIIISTLPLRRNGFRTLFRE